MYHTDDVKKACGHWRDPAYMEESKKHCGEKCSEPSPYHTFKNGELCPRCMEDQKLSWMGRLIDNMRRSGDMDDCLFDAYMRKLDEAEKPTKLKKEQ